MRLPLIGGTKSPVDSFNPARLIDDEESKSSEAERERVKLPDSERVCWEIPIPVPIQMKNLGSLIPGGYLLRFS
jgi:hypothetical protein